MRYGSARESRVRRCSRVPVTRVFEAPGRTGSSHTTDTFMRLDCYLNNGLLSTLPLKTRAVQRVHAIHAPTRPRVQVKPVPRYRAASAPAGRVSTLCTRVFLGLVAVAHARLGEQVARPGRVVFELAAQLGHVEPQVVGVLP